ncbi:MAG: hypothetical protein MUO26_09265 [Methanotrichaceae archaeon]|nr:hypothetical protein [Methanotrichaceae archaeon]
MSRVSVLLYHSCLVLSDTWAYRKVVLISLCLSKQGLDYSDIAAPGDHDSRRRVAAEDVQASSFLYARLFLVVHEHVEQVLAVPSPNGSSRNMCLFGSQIFPQKVVIEDVL